MRLQQSGILFTVPYAIDVIGWNRHGYTIVQRKISAISLMKMKVGSLHLKLKFDRGFMR